jgi:hypothetical protein
MIILSDMPEKFMELVFCIAIIVLFSLNFNTKWTNNTIEKVRDSKATWYWLRVFKIEETKENYVKMVKGLSLFVIAIMLLTIILILI